MDQKIEHKFVPVGYNEHFTPMISCIRCGWSIEKTKADQILRDQKCPSCGYSKEDLNGPEGTA